MDRFSGAVRYYAVLHSQHNNYRNYRENEMNKEVKKMKTEVKIKWLTALRSGEYKQGKGQLCNDGRFCCLGVLTDIAVKEGIGEWSSPEGIYWSGYRWTGTELPIRVAEWAGGLYPDPTVSLDPKGAKGTFGGRTTLSALNDKGVSFSNIADLIEAQL